MKFLRRLTAPVLLAVAAMSLSVPSANAANTDAAPYLHTAAAQAYGFSDCPDGLICIFTERLGFGHRAQSRALAAGECTPTLLEARSVYNRTRVTHRVWSSTNCTGTNVVVDPGEKIPDIGIRHSIGGYP
jgi:hypothetical protein